MAIQDRFEVTPPLTSQMSPRNFRRQPGRGHTLKNDERSSHVPIVLLTAKAGVQSKLEGLGVGADAYLSKPFLKEDLFIRLEKRVELRRRLQEKYAGKDFVSFSREASFTEGFKMSMSNLENLLASLSKKYFR